MLIFSISFPDLNKFPYFMDTPERKVLGERRPRDRVGDFTNTFSIYIYTYMSQNIFTGAILVYLTNIYTALCKCKIYIYIATG
jgi:hypothetical protein